MEQYGITQTSFAVCNILGQQLGRIQALRDILFCFYGALKSIICSQPQNGIAVDRAKSQRVAE